MIVTIHLGAPADRSSLTDRTTPKIVDPLKVSAVGCPLYWARRQRCASTESLVSTVCMGTSADQPTNINQTLTKDFGRTGFISASLSAVGVLPASRGFADQLF
jgi:hypothetical protein